MTPILPFAMRNVFLTVIYPVAVPLITEVAVNPVNLNCLVAEFTVIFSATVRSVAPRSGVTE